MEEVVVDWWWWGGQVEEEVVYQTEEEEEGRASGGAGLPKYACCQLGTPTQAILRGLYSTGLPEPPFLAGARAVFWSGSGS